MPALPKDAMKFAKQMGIDMSGLEAEAEDIWGMLNDMSEKNFDEYQSFIQQQFKDRKEAEEEATQGSGPKDDTKYIRPKVGFCVETRTLSGDGIKVRVADESGASTGKAMFINVCSHEAIEQPMDYGGSRIAGNWMHTTDLQIPLVVGPLRDLEENSKIAVDVMVNASVVERCEKQSSFKGQLVELVLASVMEERGMKLKTDWIPVSKVAYVGGRGAEKATPVLFPVGSKSASKEDSTPKPALQSPSTLLGALKQERGKYEDEGETPILVERPNLSAKLQVSSTLSNGSATLMNESKIRPLNASTKTTQEPLLKKGFLNEPRSEQLALYPEGGTSEGQGGAKGGVYERLMNRCQVIDTRSVGVNAVHPPPTSFSQVTKASAPAPTRDEMLQMEMLLGKADDEWTGNTHSNIRSGMEEGLEFTRALEEMSKMIIGSSLETSAAAVPSTTTTTKAPDLHSTTTAIARDVPNVTGKLFSQGKVKVGLIGGEGESGSRCVEIVVSELEDLNFSQEVVLDVGEKEINLTIRGDLTRLTHPTLRFDSSTASAVLRKKKQQLYIKVPLNTI